MRSALLVAGLAGCVIASSASGQTTVDLTPSADTTIYSGGNGLSNGAGTGVFADASRRALLKFDLSSIPAGATIDDASLTMNMNMTRAGASVTTLHRLTADWGESTSDAACCGAGGGGAGGPAAIGDATWTHSFWETITWETEGGDFIAMPHGSTVVDQSGDYTWTDALMATDAQGWLDNPTANFGWILIGDGGGKRYASREFGGADIPTLSITYTEGNTVCPCEAGGATNTVDVQDLLAFLALWFVIDIGADYNGDTVVDIVDLLEFLSCWFTATATGCEL